jgi:hypothetical protein
LSKRLKDGPFGLETIVERDVFPELRFAAFGISGSEGGFDTSGVCAAQTNGRFKELPGNGRVALGLFDSLWPALPGDCGTAYCNSDYRKDGAHGRLSPVAAPVHQA